VFAVHAQAAEVHRSSSAASNGIVRGESSVASSCGEVVSFAQACCTPAPDAREMSIRRPFFRAMWRPGQLEFWADNVLWNSFQTRHRTAENTRDGAPPSCILARCAERAARNPSPGQTGSGARCRALPSGPASPRVRGVERFIFTSQPPAVGPRRASEGSPIARC